MKLLSVGVPRLVLGLLNHQTTMNHTEVIERLCNLHSEAAGHVGLEYAADCFCGNSGLWHVHGYNPERDYRNDGKALEFIESAVREKIERDKHSLENADVDLPDTAAQDSASKSNNPAVSG